MFNRKPAPAPVPVLETTAELIVSEAISTVEAAIEATTIEATATETVSGTVSGTDVTVTKTSKKKAAKKAKVNATATTGWRDHQGYPRRRVFMGCERSSENGVTEWIRYQHQEGRGRDQQIHRPQSRVNYEGRAATKAAFLFYSGHCGVYQQQENENENVRNARNE